MNSPKTGGPTLRRGMLILVPFAFYPVIDFIFRIANGLIAPDLSAEFSLNAAQLGLISSVFFIAFGLSQLPLGLALDRFGPRRTTLFLLATAIAGALLFVRADDPVDLILGRVLLGIGMSASLIAGIKASTLWLPGRLPIATLILVGSTGVGGMIATVPFAEALAMHSWRDALLGLTATVALLFVVIACLVPGGGGERTDSIFRQMAGFSPVLRSGGLWRFAPIAMAGVGVGSAYQTLWAPLWLRDVAHFTPSKIAWTMLGMLGVYAVGNFLFGWLAQRLMNQGRSTMSVILAAFLMFVVCQIALALQITEWAVPLWILASLTLAGAYAIYPVVTGNFPSEFAARASSSLNFLVFASVFAIQWLIGVIIDGFPNTSDGGFAAEAYQWAFAVGIVLQLLAIAWYFLSRPAGGDR